MHKTVMILALVGSVLSCSSIPTEMRELGLEKDDLLSGEVLGMRMDPPDLVQEDEILALSPAMVEFLATFVDRKDSDYLKLQQLIYAIINDGTFGLDYDEVTRTAAETFRVRRGNCLSFSNMFVALAREAGLDAVYQEVDIPPDWSVDHDAYVLNRHVNVLLAVGITGEHVVDFNIDDFRATYDRRVIDDSRAFAHYYNNLGVEFMQKGDTAHAFGYFRKALAENDLRFAPAWTNLGTLYRRRGLSTYAEAAYLQALESPGVQDVAMSNLANFYAGRGDDERAERYRAKVAFHHLQNPYFRYHRAREAFYSRDFDSAIKDLRYAVRKRPKEDQFAFLLGLVYLQRGNSPAARKWMERAEELAASDILLVAHAVQIKDYSGFKAGDTLTYRMPNMPQGSRADIKALSRYADGSWTVVLYRKLDTGHDDDVAFNPRKKYNFAMALFDDSGDEDSYDSEVLILQFAR